MSYPSIFQIVSSDPTCKTLLGTAPMRFWPFGRAPQSETRPYAVHQLVSGSPQNHLSGLPKTDNIALQVDCYAKSASDARDVCDAVSGAIERSHAYVTSWNGENIAGDTGLYRITFTSSFWPKR